MLRQWVGVWGCQRCPWRRRYMTAQALTRMWAQPARILARILAQAFSRWVREVAEKRVLYWPRAPRLLDRRPEPHRWLAQAELAQAELAQAELAQAELVVSAARRAPLAAGVVRARLLRLPERAWRADGP